MNRRFFTPPLAVLLLMAVFMACFLIWPVCVTLREAFIKPGGGFTLAFVGEIFSNPIYVE